MSPAEVIIGIDPGLDGAIAGVSTGGAWVRDIPTGATPKGKREVDRQGLLAALMPHPGAAVWVEQVASMPGQGVSSSFRFGETLGVIKMAVTAAGCELRMVPPATWKRSFGLIFPKGTPKPRIKAASRSLAQDRFPGLAGQLARVKDEGRAEALLIALYGSERQL
ncbi:MAG: hypothetical protein V2I43_10510 [Parvularcula sp.]|jgi:crossover junction endodeoxyribonuclease RuvC|nr:hypothetical protein [Parvularcula sp.]